MSTHFPYNFQPQPPPHPKVTGGKRAPTAAISIPSSYSEDEDSDQSITDHSPPTQSRFTNLDLSSSSSPGSKTSIITISNIPSPRSHVISKKSSLALPSPRTLNNNNNAGTVNLNHISTPSYTSQGSATVTTPILILSNSNSHNLSNFGNNVLTLAATSSNNNNHNSNVSLSSAPSLINNNSNNATSGLSSSLSCGSILSSTSQASNATTNANTVTNASTLVNITTATNNADSSTNVTSTSATASSTSTESREEVKSETPSPSPQNRSSSPFSNFAYEHDHDYENVASPCSSTASGPIYVRPPGFKHHAQEIVAPPVKNKLKKKKCSATLITLREGFKKREQTPPKLKPKRDPLPMKLRALPQSFWQQPNVAHQVSPSTLFPILPPLPNKESEEVMMDIRPVTPPDEREAIKKSQTPERKLTVANTDLLFKLFEGIGEDKKAGTTVGKTKAQNKPRKPVPKSNTKGLFLGNDPFLVDAVTDKIFPQLTLEGSRHSSGGGNTSLQLITLKEGDKTVTLPSLSMEQNYPQMLSELVMHI